MFSLFHNGPALQHERDKQALHCQEMRAQREVSYGGGYILLQEAFIEEDLVWMCKGHPVGGLMAGNMQIREKEEEV